MSKSNIIFSIKIVIFSICGVVFTTQLIDMQTTLQTKKCSVVSFIDGVLVLQSQDGNQFIYTYDEYNGVDLSDIGSINVEFDTQGTDSVLDDEILELNDFYSENGTLLFSAN